MSLRDHKSFTVHVPSKGHKLSRRYHEKSRGGCLLCRKHHVKCDQVKPDCGRCFKRGLSCQWTSVSINTSISSVTDLNQDQLRALQFYRDQTAQALPGYFDQEFWTLAVLRISYSNPAIQQFLIAIGAADEAFLLQQTHIATFQTLSVARYQFALRQYDAAIKTLLRSLRQNKTDPSTVILTASILCTLFEHWHGNHFTAKDHATSGALLLQNMNHLNLNSCGEGEDIIRTHLLPIIVRNCIKIGLGTKLKDPVQSKSTTAGLNVLRVMFEPEIVTIIDARKRFQRLTDEIILQAERYPSPNDRPALRAFLHHFIPILDRWYYKSRHLLEIPVSTSNQYRDCCLLALRYRYTRVLLASAGDNDQMVYDNLTNDFKEILNLCSNYNKTHTGITASRRSHDMTTNLALVLVGSSCREPKLRRQAIKMMFQNPRMEGVCPSMVCAMYCEGIMKTEEQGLNNITSCTDIPCSHRIVVLRGDYFPEYKEGSDTQTDQRQGKRVRRARYIITYFRPSETMEMGDHSQPSKIHTFNLDLRIRNVAEIYPTVEDWDSDGVVTEVSKKESTQGEYFLGHEPYVFHDSKDLRTLFSLQRFVMQF